MGAGAVPFVTGVGATFVYEVPEAYIGKHIRVTCTPTAQWDKASNTQLLPRTHVLAEAVCTPLSVTSGDNGFHGVQGDGGIAVGTGDGIKPMPIASVAKGTAARGHNSDARVRCVGVPVSITVGPVVACPPRPWVHGAAWYGATHQPYTPALVTPTPMPTHTVEGNRAIAESHGPCHGNGTTAQSLVLDVMTYNVLADCYAASPHGRQNLFSYCDDTFLQRDYREQLLVAELAARECDIVCLQEVETHEYVLLEMVYSWPLSTPDFLPHS